MFSSTGQLLDNSLHSEIPPLNALPSQHNAGSAVVRSGQVILGDCIFTIPLSKSGGVKQSVYLPRSYIGPVNPRLSGVQ